MTSPKSLRTVERSLEAFTGGRRRLRMIFRELLVESFPESLAGISSTLRAYPLVRWILCGERSENLCLGRFLWRKPEKKNQHLHPIEADHTPLSYGSKGDREGDPLLLEPGLQGSEEFRTFVWRKVGEMGFVGRFRACLPLPALQQGWCARIRPPSGETGLLEAASECCDRVAAGRRWGATRMQPGCNPDATVLKCCNRVTAGRRGRRARVWRPGEIGREIGLFLQAGDAEQR